jgi:hypothetical protein
MSNKRKFGARPFGMVAAAALAAGLVTTGSSVASASDSPTPPTPTFTAPSDSATVVDSTLIVVGSDDDDQIALNVDPRDPNRLVVDFGAAAPRRASISARSTPSPSS